MYVFRGLRDTDPWADTAPDSSPGILDKLSSSITSAISAVTPSAPTVPPVPTVTPSLPGSTSIPTGPTPTPWYKTWPGIIGIGVAGFLGYKLYERRKKAA